MKNINILFNARFLVLFLFLFSFSNVSAQTVDSDGDGIVDQLDLDDDNDGILDTAECGSVTSVNMVNWMNSVNTFPGDIQSGFNTYITAQNSTIGNGLTRTWSSGGSYQALSQIAATTEAQAITNNEYVEYRITLGNRYLALNEVEYYITGSGFSSTTYNYTLRMSVDNFSTNTLLHGAQSYTPAAAGVNVTIPTTQTMYLYANTTYVFRVYFYNVAGGNSGTIAHDDFKLRGNFECDADGDNIPNRLDLDSDNDGCFDAIEGDENVLLNQLTSGRINIATTGGIGTTVGTNNGVPNLINPTGTADVGADIGQGLGDSQNSLVNTQCIDTDGDGVQNDFDLDDDNDGILDTVEDACAYEGTPVYINNFGTGPRASDANVLGHTYTTSTTISDGFYGVTTSSGTTETYNQTDLIGGIDAGNPTITAGSTAGRYLAINIAPNFINQAFYRTPSVSVTSGARYRFRIDMAGLGNGAASVPNLQISIKDTSGNVLATANSGGIGMANDDVWRRLNLNFTATTSAVVLEIVNLQGNGGAGNDLGVDNIILAPVVICDTDGDGIPNSLDLDSDGDGCSDVIEGGANFQAGASYITGNRLNTTVNASGVPAVPTATPAITGYTQAAGQSVAQSQDWTKNDCLDTDGDGIPNWQDLDDDNDGIADTLEDACATEGTPVYINTFGTGGREADPNVQNHTFVSSGTIGDGFYSVTTSGATSDTFSQTELNGNLDAGNPVITAGSTAGRYLMINIDAPSTVNKPIYRVSNLPTIIGGRYRFRVDMAGLSTGAVPILVLTLKDTSGNVLATSNSNNIGVANDDIWRRLTLDFVATTSSVVLEIVNMQSNGGGNDVGIDNIILTPINICDNDGDGIPNSQDLDSDGDGCPDAIEGGAPFTNANLVTATGTISTQTPNQNLGNTVGNTATTIGIPTVAGTGQSLGQSQDGTKNDCVDSDGDGIPDWQDLDDDNDGILDTVECPQTNIFANFSSATISGANTNSATVTGIGFGGVTGTLTRVNNGTGVVVALSNTTSDFSNATIFTPAGSATQATLSEALNGYKGTTNYTRYTLNLDKPVESITLHFGSFDYMRTRFVGTHAELLLSAGTETVYNARQLYDSAPNTVLTVTRDGYGSIKITSKNGMPISQIIFEKYDDPNSNSSFVADGFGFTFSVQPACDSDGDGIPDRLDLDSDNDGCPDAIEGGADITTAQLVNAGGTLQGGNGTNPVVTPTSGSYNQSVLLNLCATSTCVNTSGVPQLSPLPTGYNNTTGQTTGDSQNALINLCYCYKKPVLDAGTTIPVQHGITALTRANSGTAEWPVVRQSAWTVLEAKTKGFVVNRLAFEDADANAATPTTPVGIPAANFVEGMMVYDTIANCLKVYNGTIWNCYSTQTCPQ